jgi:hypothetical protein
MFFYRSKYLFAWRAEDVKSKRIQKERVREREIKKGVATIMIAKSTTLFGPISSTNQ